MGGGSVPKEVYAIADENYCGKTDLIETKPDPFGDAKARIKRHLSAIVEEEHVPDLEWHANAILQIIQENPTPHIKKWPARTVDPVELDEIELDEAET